MSKGRNGEKKNVNPNVVWDYPEDLSGLQSSQIFSHERFNCIPTSNTELSMTDTFKEWLRGLKAHFQICFQVIKKKKKDVDFISKFNYTVWCV